MASGEWLIATRYSLLATRFTRYSLLATRSLFAIRYSPLQYLWAKGNGLERGNAWGEMHRCFRGAT